MPELTQRKLNSLMNKVKKEKPWNRQKALLKALAKTDARYRTLWQLAADSFFTDDPSSEIAGWQLGICLDAGNVTMAKVSASELASYLKGIDQATLEGLWFFQGTTSGVLANFLYPSPDAWLEQLDEFPAAIRYGVAAQLRLRGVEVSLPEGFTAWLAKQLDQQGNYFSVDIPKDAEGWDAARAAGSHFMHVDGDEAGGEACTSCERAPLDMFVAEHEYDAG